MEKNAQLHLLQCACVCACARVCVSVCVSLCVCHTARPHSTAAALFLNLLLGEDAWLLSRPGRLISRETPRDLVGSKAGLNVLEKRKIICPWPESSPHLPQTSHWTNWAMGRIHWEKYLSEANDSGIFVVKLEGKRPPRRPWIRWDGNVKQARKETEGKELDASGFGKGQEESWWKHTEESSGCRNCGEFLDYPRILYVSSWRRKDWAACSTEVRQNEVVAARILRLVLFCSLPYRNLTHAFSSSQAEPNTCRITAQMSAAW